MNPRQLRSLALPLLAAAFVLAPPAAHAEVIGIENFDYFDGSIDGKRGGIFWDWSENTAAPAHTGTTSTWDVVSGSPVIDFSALLTSNSSAKREFNGSSEADGAFNGNDVVYFRTSMTRQSGITWSGLSSYDFGNERLFFGVLGQPNPASGNRELGIEIGSPFSSTTYSGITPVDGQTYTLVAKLDFAADKLSLWVDPDFGVGEAGNAPAVTVGYTGTNWSTAVRLGSGGAGITGWDNLFVATTWAEVAPLFIATQSDGELTITGYDSNRDGVKDCPVGPLTIPASIGGVPVKAIGDSAFRECSGLTSLTLPNGLTSIGSSAFFGCSGLTSLTLPNGLTSIAGFAFTSCSSLPSLTLPDGLTSIGESAFSNCSGLTSLSLPNGLTTIGRSAFSRCRALTSLTLPDGLITIGSSAFSSCSGLTSLTLPDGLTTIEFIAFTGCTRLTTVTLPAALTSIGTAAFGYCDSLTDITVADGNANYSSFDGLLYNLDKSTLLQFPCGKVGQFSLPASLTSIGRFAFSGCSGLTSLTLPAGLTSIGESAFRDCSGLTSLTLPAGLTNIDSFAFEGCSSLTSVYFFGDAPELSRLFALSDNPEATVYYVVGTSGWGGLAGGLPTAPWDPAGQITSIVLSADNIDIMWLPFLPVASPSYRVERSPDGVTWTTVPGLNNVTGTTASIPRSSGAARLFVRVVGN